MKKKVLFLCVANSARSQMAEGLARKLLGPSVQVESAGSQPTQLNPFAIRAMSEIGIDIRAQSSKAAATVDMATVDLVITLCAEEVCPAVPATTRKLQWTLPDPASMGATDEERMAGFRKVRDEIASRISELKRAIS